MNMNYKKSLKLVTFLITAVIIATASAEVYRYIYIEGGITVGTAKLVWLEGTDVSSTIVGGTASFTLNVEDEIPINFTEALFLKNVDGATNSYDYTISVMTALSSSDFEVAKIHIYENYTTPWTYLGTVDLTSSSSTYANTLADGDYLRLTIEVKAIQDSITRNFKVQVEYSPA